jgi:ribosome-associated protein
MSINCEALRQEIKFKTSRSSGPGGQHVNKTESKVILLWDYSLSSHLTHFQKEVLSKKLSNRISADGLFQLEVSSSRIQLENKEIALDKFFKMIVMALTPVKKRIATKIPRSKVLDRLNRKAKHAEKKSNRKWRLD